MFRSSSGKTVARRLTIGALALVIPALVGCEAGNNAPTLSQYHPASGGTYTTFNGISINNAFVLGAPSGSLPAGSSASLFISFFNNGSTDKLVSVTAPGTAANAQLTGGGVNLPADSSVNLTGPSPSVVISGLAKPLSSGGSIAVTLDFQHAGATTIQVPVQPRAFQYSTFSPPPASPSASPSTQPAKPAPSTSPLGRATPTPTPTK